MSPRARNARLDRTLAALADPHRRAVVDLLRERPRRAGELAADCAMSGPAMSRHLRVLRASGLVEVAAEPAMSRHLRTLRESGLVEESHAGFDARVRVYSLRSGAMNDLKKWLEETERLWTEQLAAFKAHLETRG
jgi:DNA-binding transcriptional ArsR family regulator